MNRQSILEWYRILRSHYGLDHVSGHSLRSLARTLILRIGLP